MLLISSAFHKLRSNIIFVFIISNFDMKANESHNIKQDQLTDN